jgi:hypothetical protein
MSNKVWTVNLEEDPDTGELILPLNEEILEACELQEGDSIKWIDRGDGSWAIEKVQKSEDTEWVQVDCVASYRMRYMVEVPKGKAEWALDTVVCQEAKEFSQEYLGEQIVSHRIVSQEEALELCDKDNSYCESWTDDLKIKNFFTKEGERPNIF